VAPKNPTAKTPAAKSTVPPRHDDRRMWETIADILSVVGGIAGIAALFPTIAQPALALIAGLASGASTIISCILGGDQMINCVLGFIFLALPGASSTVKAFVKDWVIEAVGGAGKALGITGNSLGIATGGGDLIKKATGR
jgi:hypothetical protein